MKIKNGFIIREIAGECIIVPTGQAAIDFNGLVSVNEVGKFIWDVMQSDVSEEDIVDKILEEYEIDRNTAKADVKEFLDSLKAAGILEN